MKSSVPRCLSSASKVALPANAKVFEAGDRCEHFYYVLDGTIRVDLMTRAGKPVTLYRVSGGETCILTTSCLLSGDLYNAEAIVEEPVQALAIPLTKFQSLLESSTEFRALVFSSFALRLSAMMVKIEEVISVPIDQRLAVRALELCAEQHPIIVTHDQLAADLGTAREVISRKLASWEGKGWIRRARGSFSITNKRQLERLANDYS